MIATFPTLDTDRLTLKQFIPENLENVFHGLSHPQVIKYYGVSYDSLESTKEQMKWFEDLESNGTGIWWAIYSKEDKQFIGAGGFNNLEKQHRKAEIGFWLLPAYWGRGFMKEAMPVICNYGFEILNLHRIEGYVDAENKNCKNGLAKLDFNYEGTMVDCEVKNGKFLSIDIYASINPGPRD